MRISRSFDVEEIPSALLNAVKDERLSHGARGLLVHILTHADDGEWEANVITLAKDAKNARGAAGEGRDAIRNLLNELKACGYVHSRRVRSQRGQLGSTLEVFDAPQEADHSPLPAAPADPLDGKVVYLIGAEGASVAKIGATTGSPAARLKGIQTGSPVRLSVLWNHSGDRRLEWFLHESFSDCRLEGEWFDFGDSDPIVEVSRATERFFQEGAWKAS